MLAVIECCSVLQVLSGIYPIAQLQEPYSSVGYICERTAIISMLKLQHPSLQDARPAIWGDHKAPEPGWTAWDVCEGKERVHARRAPP